MGEGASVLLPCGYSLGEGVYFVGARQHFDNGDRLQFGHEGSIEGLAGEDGRLRVRFSGHKEDTILRPSEITREPPKLPSGYKVGDRIYWCGDSEHFASGDRLEFSLEGEVVGRCTQGSTKDDESVAVSFEGNKRITDVLVSSISKHCPQIPGGYRIGDELYFSGARQTFNDGDKLEFGLMGQVVARATVEENQPREGERLMVRFQGNKKYTAVRLSDVSRESPAIPGGYSLGDIVHWIGPPQTLASGDQLKVGLSGEVVGRAATRYDGRDDERLSVRFAGHRKNTPVFLGSIVSDSPLQTVDKSSARRLGPKAPESPPRQPLSLQPPHASHL
jgi:hypothetical protein